MLGVLTLGLALWVVYGVIRSDWIIIVANAIGGSLSGIDRSREQRDLSQRTALLPLHCINNLTRKKWLGHERGASRHLQG